MNVCKDRINSLRVLMKQNNLSYYIVTTVDFHSSEYVGEYFKCREYLSGFTGSAGTLLVGLESAYLYTDGRYFIQAADELKGSDIELMKSGEAGVPVLSDLLCSLVKPGEAIGFDGRTVSISFYDILKEKLPDNKFVTNVDLAGEVWEKRPKLKFERVWELDEKFAGQSREFKIFNARNYLRDNKLDAIFVSALDETNWLLNIRGNDIAYCPMALSYVYVDLEKVILFANKASIDEALLQKFLAEKIEVKDYFEAYAYLNGLNDLKIGLDYRKANVSILEALKANVVVSIDSPIELPKAIKNETEIANIKKAHEIDGVAVCKFLAKLSELDEAGELAGGKYTEKTLERMLLEYRSEGEGFIEESFAPIIATGDHGAIVHYEATESTDKPIENDTLLLMDTGGHYIYGTTDITRTIAVGNPSSEMIYHYTLVLKGHIDLALARFKKGMVGKDLDEIARKPLWDAGLDFNHGTGHGVGYLLNVHEGPQTISFRAKRNVPFEAGMVTSDEPGLYFEGKYGIRTENMVLCKVNGEFLCFEPLTLVPYDYKLIDKSLLSVEELEYLDYYNACVYNKMVKYLDACERNWLRKATEQ